MTIARAALALAGWAALVPGRPIGAQEAGVEWLDDLDLARAEADRRGRPICLELRQVHCPPCHVLEERTLADERVAAACRRELVCVRLDIHSSRAAALVYDRYHVSDWTPQVLFLDSLGRPLRSFDGPESPEVFLRLLSEARADLDETARLEGDRSRTADDNLALGLVLARRGLLEESIAPLEAALSGGSSRPAVAWRHLVAGYRRAGRHADAARAFESVLAADGDGSLGLAGPLLLERAEADLALLDLEAAALGFRAACDLPGGRSVRRDALAGLAHCLERLGRDREALEAFLALALAGDERPGRPAVLERIERLESRTGEGGGSLEEEALLPAAAPGERALFERAVEFTKVKDHAAAAAVYQAFVESHPRSALHPIAMLHLAQCYLTLRHYEGAIEVYEAYLETHPDHGRAAWARRHIERTRQALEMKRREDRR